MLPSGPPSGSMTVAPRPTKRGQLGVDVVGLQVDVDPVLHDLGLGHQLEPEARGAARALHQHGRVVLDVVDAHAPEPLELGVVVGRHLVAVEHLGPEPGERRRVRQSNMMSLDAGHAGSLVAATRTVVD